MRKFTVKELKEIQAQSNDLWNNVLRCKELVQEGNDSEYNTSYELLLNNSISLAIQTLYNKTIATHQGV